MLLQDRGRGAVKYGDYLHAVDKIAHQVPIPENTTRRRSLTKKRETLLKPLLRELSDIDLGEVLWHASKTHGWTEDAVKAECDGRLNGR